ncbi:PhoD-like phosphatase N-terminal domain-containing protein [Kribbella sp. CWNU-51]
MATRRSFLTATGAAAALALTGNLPDLVATAIPHRTDKRPLFTLGVASGDPLSDAVVIWTRLAPGPLEPFGGMDDRAVDVEWEVAEDEAFRRVVRRGTARARPEYAHTVHVDVRGLRPWRHYFYRFRAAGQISPVGRTRTAPAPADQPAVTMAVASCQAFYDGFYTAYQDVVRRDHDVVLFLGDYIYEVGIGPTAGVRNQTVPVDFAGEIFTLDEYRARYALHKTDPDLSRQQFSSYLPVDQLVTAPLEITVPRGTTPATHTVDLSVGREHLKVPVAIKPVPQRDDVLLGEQAVASSTNGDMRLCGGVDGNSDSAQWGASGWHDSTKGAFPDTYGVDFLQPTMIGRVVLQTLDSARYPAAVMGIRDFDIQVRTGDTWTTVGEVRGNVLGKVTVTFGPRAVDAVQLVSRDSNDHGYSRIVELEAYGS